MIRAQVDDQGSGRWSGFWQIVRVQVDDQGSGR